MIYRRLPVLLLVVILLFSSWLLQPTAASAADNPNGVTFTISPALVDKKVKPGQSFDITLTLTNHSQKAQPFKAYTKNFAAKSLDGQVTFGDENITSFAASTWISLDQPSILLPPGGKQSVVATITVPTNAEPGGHYASVLFEQMVQDVPSQSSHVAIAARLAALIFLTVDGDIREAGQILGATPGSACSAVVCGFKAPRFLDVGPVPFSFIFSNTGNVHVRPKGTITIYQGKQKVATLPIEDRAVLPNSQRIFETKWDRVVLSGHYTAKLHLVYGSKNYTLDATTDFWAFPWQIVLGLAITAVLVYGIFLSRKYFRVKRLHRKTKTSRT
jgi:hypothetical protein